MMGFSRWVGASEEHLSVANLGLRYGIALWLLVLLIVGRAAAAEEPRPRPDLYFFAVGIGTYADPLIPPRPFAVDDARALEHIASLQQHRYFNDVRTQLVVDDQADRDHLLQELTTFFGPARPFDQRIVFIAAHGVRDPSAEQWYVITQDTRLEELDETALNQAQLLNTLSRDSSRAALEGVGGAIGGVGGAISGATSGDGAPAGGGSTGNQPGRSPDANTHPDDLPRPLLLLIDTHPTIGASEPIGLPHQIGDRSGHIWSQVGSIDAVQPSSAASILQLTAGPSCDAGKEGDKRHFSAAPPGTSGHSLFAWTLLQALGTILADTDGDGLLNAPELLTFINTTVQREASGAQLPELSGSSYTGVMAWTPGVPEVCNRVDDNDDGRVDEGFDEDGDGFPSKTACGNRFGNDCNDQSPKTHPGQRDYGNLVDDDCDGVLDEDDLDMNSNGIPDTIEGRSRRLKRNSRGALIASALLLVGSGLTYRSIHSLQNEHYIPSATGPWLVLSYGSVTLAGLSGGSVWLWRYLEGYRRHFDHEFLTVGTSASRSPTQ